MDEEDDDKDDDKMSKEEAIEKIADFFKKEVFPKVRKEEPELLAKIKKKIQNHEMKENYLREAEEDDDKNSSKDRKANRREKGMIYGGLGTMGAGMIASLGEFMGYSDFEMTGFLHDLNQMAGKAIGAGIGAAKKAIGKAVTSLVTKKRKKTLSN